MKQLQTWFRFHSTSLLRNWENWNTPMLLTFLLQIIYSDRSISCPAFAFASIVYDGKSVTKITPWRPSSPDVATKKFGPSLILSTQASAKGIHYEWPEAKLDNWAWLTSSSALSMFQTPTLAAPLQLTTTPLLVSIKVAEVLSSFKQSPVRMSQICKMSAQSRVMRWFPCMHLEPSIAYRLQTSASGDY